LNDIFFVRSGEEEGAGLCPGKVPVASDERLQGAFVPLVGSLDEIDIVEPLELTLSFGLQSRPPLVFADPDSV
jgi:hypothetical protein